MFNFNATVWAWFNFLDTDKRASCSTHTRCTTAQTTFKAVSPPDMLLEFYPVCAVHILELLKVAGYQWEQRSRVRQTSSICNPTWKNDIIVTAVNNYSCDKWERWYLLVARASETPVDFQDLEQEEETAEASTQTGTLSGM